MDGGQHLEDTLPDRIDGLASSRVQGIFPPWTIIVGAAALQ
jgi:hypothetical protein